MMPSMAYPKDHPQVMVMNQIHDPPFESFSNNGDEKLKSDNLDTSMDKDSLRNIRRETHKQLMIRGHKSSNEMTFDDSTVEQVPLLQKKKTRQKSRMNVPDDPIASRQSKIALRSSSQNSSKFFTNILTRFNNRPGKSSVKSKTGPLNYI